MRDTSARQTSHGRPHHVPYTQSADETHRDPHRLSLCSACGSGACHSRASPPAPSPPVALHRAWFSPRERTLPCEVHPGGYWLFWHTSLLIAVSLSCGFVSLSASDSAAVRYV